MNLTSTYYLVFDTETAGLPKNWKAPLSEVNNWPRIVQLAWALYDNRGTLIESQTHLIRPVGFSIPASATQVHGITTEQALREGKDLASVLEVFVDRLNRSELLVAHNIDFDAKIVGAELYRLNSPLQLAGKRQICTMQASTNYLKLPGRYGFKWPSLSELHTALFTTDFAGAHDAMNDVKACAKCFFALKDRGVILFS